MILTLDISTAVIGYAVGNAETKEIICTGAIKFPKKTKKKPAPTLYVRGRSFKTFLQKDITKFPISRIVIESPAMMFGDQSTAHTISLLQFFNGMISLMCFELFGVEPEHVYPNAARNSAGIKVPKGTKGKATKVYISEWVYNLYPFRKNQKELYTKEGNLISGVSDEADAIVLLLYGFATS